jgi:DNA-binding protein H-NS
LDKEVPKSLSQVTAQIEKLQREAKTLKDREVKAVIARIKEAIGHYGLTSSDLGLAGSRGAGRGTAAKIAVKKGAKRAARKAAGVPKYRSADGKTWTGHGRAPNWYKEALASGSAPESLLLKA